MVLMRWEDTLYAAGVEVDAESGNLVRLRSAGQEHLFHVERWRRPPRPSELQQRSGMQLAARRPTLVVAPHLSEQVRQLLADRRVSFVTDDATVLYLGSETITVGRGDASLQRADPPAATALPFRGLSAYQVVRRIIQRGLDRPQRLIARDACVSQPRVSQTIARLRDAGFLGQGTPHVEDLYALLAGWLEGYPGPGGVATNWFSLDPPAEAASIALRAARDSGVRALLSGDVAADLLAPWGRPRRAVVYADRAVDLAAVGLVRTPEHDAAIVTLVVPDDPTTAPPPDRHPTVGTVGGLEVRVADELQVLWDVTRGPSHDTAEAASVLQRRLLEDWGPIHR